MIEKNYSEIFKCHYTDASRYDRIFVWSMGIGFMVIFILLRHKGNIYPFLIFELLFMLLHIITMRADPE